MIDWSQVDELKDEMADSFDEIVEVFLEEVDESIAKLAPGGSAESLAAGLHFLKGAALNLGFTQFAELCGTGEKLAEQGQVAGIDVGAVQACYKLSREEFLAGLQRRAA